MFACGRARCDCSAPPAHSKLASSPCFRFCIIWGGCRWCWPSARPPRTRRRRIVNPRPPPPRGRPGHPARAAHASHSAPAERVGGGRQVVVLAAGRRQTRAAHTPHARALLSRSAAAVRPPSFSHPTPRHRPHSLQARCVGDHRPTPGQTCEHAPRVVAIRLAAGWRCLSRPTTPHRHPARRPPNSCTMPSTRAARWAVVMVLAVLGVAAEADVPVAAPPAGTCT